MKRKTPIWLASLFALMLCFSCGETINFEGYTAAQYGYALANANGLLGWQLGELDINGTKKELTSCDSIALRYIQNAEVYVTEGDRTPTQSFFPVMFEFKLKENCGYQNDSLVNLGVWYVGDSTDDQVVSNELVLWSQSPRYRYVPDGEGDSLRVLVIVLDSLERSVSQIQSLPIQQLELTTEKVGEIIVKKYDPFSNEN
ncbi:hypothetical protein [Aureibacter tunicatorum]|uniref:Uncharacterized protein n=1 Tax=Aureibacter tunicatorum TaxID=866807 RepID=A0AAE4BQC8_9BACT|nr:hypothetical protein [Aureibacter tunicatorum]MDR6238959.1 hypothetical protein [Aureibacter tunicatorum]BDD05115.1 hypothetical protein AUTU_25980 [Aureibacter tunicatorum]